MDQSITTGQVTVESLDKMWSTGEGNGKPLEHSCLNPMNTMKIQKDMTLKDGLPRLVGDQYATGEEWRNSSRGMKQLSQSGNKTQVWMSLVVKVKSNAERTILLRNLLKC